MMSTNSTVMPALPTADLRSEAKAYNRDKSHATKWAHGGRSAPGKSCSHELSGVIAPCQQCIARPAGGARNFGNHYFNRSERASIHANTHAHRQGNLAKKVLQHDLHDITVNSDTGSSDEEVAHISEAPVPDNEVMYSYDAQSGPSNGADVLSNAVIQAVKRFENKQTEQLVKNEYDLVLDSKDFEDLEAYAGDAEEDFEFVAHEHAR